MPEYPQLFDLYAAAALQGLLANPKNKSMTKEKLAKRASEIAQAALKERGTACQERSA